MLGLVKKSFRPIFDGAEFIVRNLMRLSGETDSFVLDMHRVTFLTEGGARLLHDVRKSLFAQGKALVYSRIRGRAAVLNALRHTVPEGDNGPGRDTVPGQDTGPEQEYDRGHEHGSGPQEGGGHGLLGMRERVRLHGGHLRAGPCADGGFEVRATFPLTGDRA